MPNRYLITGCSGFIGAKVTEKLLSNGHEIVGIDNLNHAYDPKLKQWRLDQLYEKPNFTFHKLDISHKDELGHVFKDGFDAVINLSARAGVRHSLENPWDYVDTNITGTLNLLDLCRQFSVNKFVLASTSSLYGEQNNQPFTEDINTDNPLSPYAASKKAAEVLCYTYHHLYRIDISVLRFFTVYGPAGRPDMSPFRFVKWVSEEQPLTIYGDGNQSRDFTYVDDIALGTILSLKKVGFEVINLGSDHPIVLMDLIRLIEKHIGKSAKIVYQDRHPSDVLQTWANIDKARKLIGWEPTTMINEGVLNLVNWYKDNQRWASTIRT